MDVPLSKFTSWPPFYTLQPNLDTQSQQLFLWSQLILEYSKQNKIFVATIETFNPITRNAQINRSLSEDFKENLVKYMKKQKLIQNEGTTLMIFWQKPETWAESMYKWAVNTGRIGTVETIEGLVSGDETINEEFYGMPLLFAMHVLKNLEKNRKAEIFQVSDSFAVKFF
jgi:ESCRT-II complex subunit VPS25